MAFKFKLHDYSDPVKPENTVCIGGPMLNSEYVNAMLGSAGGADCEFCISSVGGDLKQGIDMFDAIKAYGKADTRIGAMAASSAGVIAMAGRKVTMSKYGLLMLHKPMTSAAGNADDINESVKVLNIMQSRIAQIYMDKSGLDEVTINSLINSVTWLTADQALDLGFIDAIEDYEAEVLNHALVKPYAETAPAVYQRVFNKLQIAKTTDSMKTEDAELIKKTEGLLTKIMNFFTKITNKTVTDKGTLNHVGPLAVGNKVTNEDDSEAEDGEYSIDNNGVKAKVKVENGVVTNMEGEKADEAETEEEVANNLVLNTAGIKVTNKAEIAGIAKVITNHIGTINTQNALIAELRGQLEVSNAAVSRDESAIRETIQSEYNVEGSKRSDKGGTVSNSAVPAFLTKAQENSPIVQNALKKAKIG